MRWLLLGMVSCVIGACGSIADEPLELIENPREREPPASPGAVVTPGGGTSGSVGPTSAPSAQVRTSLDAGSARDAGDSERSSDAAIGDAALPFLADALAPLPPAQDGGGFNAIYVPSVGRIYLPLFSMPSCQVVPPYGEAYVVSFEHAPAGPSGVFASCFIPPGQGSPTTTPCYTPARMISLDLSGYMLGTQNFAGGRYELSAFDPNGIATGFMSTQQGLVPLAVKRCP